MDNINKEVVRNLISQTISSIEYADRELLSDDYYKDHLDNEILVTMRLACAYVREIERLLT